MKRGGYVYLLVLGLLGTVKAYMELPKFQQMRILYPGYYLHGGKYRDSDIISLIGGNRVYPLHNTAGIRMSYALNKYGGRHAIGTEPVMLSNVGRDSYTGRDQKEFIFRNTAFGPFLAAKYGNPIVEKPDKHDHTRTMDPFRGKQGTVRLVSYRRNHPGGHIALWDCDHFHESRDWTSEIHMISVEFWEAPDSFCPPPKASPDPTPHLARVEVSQLHLVARHNFGYDHIHEEGRRRRKKWDPNLGEYRPNPKTGSIWIQK